MSLIHAHTHTHTHTCTHEQLVVKCPSLTPPPSHTHICHTNTSEVTSLPFTYGSTIHYCCDEGYTLGAEHVGVVNCTELGKWNNTIPTCEGTHPHKHIRVHADKHTRVHTQTHTCAHKHTRVHTNTHVCTRTHTCAHRHTKLLLPHSHPAVTCQAPHQEDHTFFISENSTANASAPGSLDHFPYGTRLAFSCDSGYTLLGSDVITCGGGGGWSHDIPTCRSKKCCCSMGTHNF